MSSLPEGGIGGERRIAAMQEAGAAAYLTKGGSSEDLIATIRACARSRFQAE